MIEKNDFILVYDRVIYQPRITRIFLIIMGPFSRLVYSVFCLNRVSAFSVKKIFIEGKLILKCFFFVPSHTVDLFYHVSFQWFSFSCNLFIFGTNLCIPQNTNIIFQLKRMMNRNHMSLFGEIGNITLGKSTFISGSV